MKIMEQVAEGLPLSGPDDASRAHWSLSATIVLAGAITGGGFGYIFYQILFFEATGKMSQTLPPLVFTGLITLLGAFMFAGGVIEGLKKVRLLYFPESETESFDREFLKKLGIRP